MRFFHLADLHIGKRLNNFNLLADQEYILTQIAAAAKELQPDAILICGDVYDKATPSAEAVALFDNFLTELSQLKKPILIISGNHDSPERLNFGSRIMARENIYLAGMFSGVMQHLRMSDQFGDIVFHLLPFVKPAQVRAFFPEEKIDSYQDAVHSVLKQEHLSADARHVLLAHQFVTAGGNTPERSDSEQISLGTLDNIDASVFGGYDYVALGHIHKAQQIGAAHIRYAGSPLKYSFSEALHHKSISLVTLEEKGSVNIEKLPLTPLHDLREIKGSLAQLLQASAAATDNHDYLHITLTDETDLVDPLAQLRNVYPHIMKMDFSASRYGLHTNDDIAQNIEQKTPIELFSEFYQLQQNISLDETKLNIIKETFARLGGEE